MGHQLIIEYIEKMISFDGNTDQPDSLVSPPQLSQNLTGYESRSVHQTGLRNVTFKSAKITFADLRQEAAN